MNAFADGPAFTSDISITTNTPDIKLIDSDANDADWEICVDNGCDSTFAGAPNEGFNISVVDGAVSSRPVSIHNNARTDALRLNGNNVGMGTAAPLQNLHIFAPKTGSGSPFFFQGLAGIRLEGEEGSFSGGGSWDIKGHANFQIQKAGGPSHSFFMNGNTGNLGLGTNSPGSSLHIRKDDANVLIESTAAAPVAIVLDLEHNGIPAFRLNNTAIDNKWAFAAQSDQSFTLSKAGSGATEMKIRANGDVEASGDVYAKGVMLTSSRAAKTDIEPIKSNEIMEKLKQIEVAEWRYKTSDNNDRHISPMAEDFYSLFKFGPSEKHINPNDLASVALIAAKELQKKSEIVSGETVALKAETKALKAENASLKDRLASLEKLVTNLASSGNLLPETGAKVVLMKK